MVASVTDAVEGVVGSTTDSLSLQERGHGTRNLLPLPFRKEGRGEGTTLRDRKTLGYAKLLRRELTPAEARHWYHLRAKRFAGAKFRRQTVIGPYHC